MNKRHRWLLTGALVLMGGVWLVSRWRVDDMPSVDVPGVLPSVEQPVAEQIAAPAIVGEPAMPPAEREWLAEEGVLTNADRPLDALSRDPAVIMMRNAIIDTEALRRGVAPVNIPDEFRARADYRRAIVVFDESITGKHWDLIAEHGLRVEHFVPNRALAVSGPHELIVRLKNEPAIRHIEPFHPFFKMNRDIQAHLTGTADAYAAERAASGRYHVLLFGDPETAFEQAMQPEPSRSLPALGTGGAVPASGAFGVAGAQVHELPRLPRQAVAEVSSDPGLLKQLVLADAVKWIEPRPNFETMNDLGRKTTGNVRMQAALTGYHLDGTGQIIGVVDTGADVNHPALSGRLLPGGYLVKESATSDGLIGDVTGHGTHVLGTILGSGALSDTVGSAPGSGRMPDGAYASHRFAGMATNAQYVMIEDFNSYTHAEMAWEAYSRGARLANNSWGMPGNFEYGIPSMFWDALVKDANWGDTNKLYAYTVLFAAGNSGAGFTDGTAETGGTISQPGNAKNVITIGALEQKRRADNLTQAPYNSLTATDSDWQVASFSGRGPTLDGRVKPDLVAPGEYVLSIQSSAINSEIIEEPTGEIRDFNHGNVDTGGKYMFMSGTSRSTAFASGAAALLRQFYMAGGYDNLHIGVEPSPALMKALMISGARPVHSAAYEWGPKRDASSLAVGSVTHAGTITNLPAVIHWWRFNGDYRNLPSLNVNTETNLFKDPGDWPGYVTAPPTVDIEGDGANPGFGSFARFQGGQVRFEITEEAYSNQWHNTELFEVAAIEFWIKRDVYSGANFLRFESGGDVVSSVALEYPNIVNAYGAGMDAAQIWVNGSTLLPILDDGWNHVVVLPTQPIYATNFTLGNITADIDELRFYGPGHTLTPDLILHNYTNGLGHVIPPDADTQQQLGGMYRESIIHDGWGKLDLAGSILGAETFESSEIIIFDDQDNDSVGPDDVWEYPLIIPANVTNGSLKVTLVWTDVHGTPGSARMLVNDLDLRVRYKPDTKEEVRYLGNLLGRETWGIASYPVISRESGIFDPMSVQPGRFAMIKPLVLGDWRQTSALRDNRNNVEQIIIRDLVPGVYVIEVEGVAVPVGWHEGMQPFALVVNKGVSSAGEPIGEQPALAVDRDNTPVLAYTTQSVEGRDQVAVRRWIDSHTNLWPEWRLLENKWFHYGDGGYREIISRSDIGGAHSPTLAFDTNNALYAAWVQQNIDPAVPDAVYLRYLTRESQGAAWDGTNRWQQLGVSYQDRGISGAYFADDAVSPVVGVGWKNQPVVAWRQGTRVLVKHWCTNAPAAWRGLDGSEGGLVSASAGDMPIEMAIDFVGHPVLAWPDTDNGVIRIVRWSGSDWRPVAGGILGDASATDISLACDDFGGIAVSWITAESGEQSVRAAKTSVGGAAWRGLGSAAANSMQHPGIFSSTNANVSASRAAFTPRGNLMVAWLAPDAENLARPLMRKWDGVQWAEIAGSSELPGIYDTLGDIEQPALVSDGDGYPLVAFRGYRTSEGEVQVMRSQTIDLGGTDPVDPVGDPPKTLVAVDVSGTSGVYAYGDAVSIAVQFATNVSVVGSPILKLDTIPERYAVYVSNSAPDTLVFRYKVRAGDSGGPWLDYSGSDALKLNSGALLVGGDWYFHSETPAPGTPGSLSFNNNIEIDGTAYTLEVQSARGVVDPARGLNWLAANAAVTAGVLDSPVVHGVSTQYVAVGWSGTGSLPADPAQNHPNVFFETQNTNVSFNIAADSTLTWLWETNYWLETDVVGPGSIDIGSNWRKRGVDVEITATENGQPFGFWAGDTNGCTIVGNSITVPMDRTRFIVAVFNPHKLAVYSEHGVPMPPNGIQIYVHNSHVNASVSGSPVDAGNGVQAVAVGWSGTGSLPDAPAQNHPNVFFETQNTNLSFNIKSYSTLTWLWETNYWLDTGVNGNGDVSVSIADAADAADAADVASAWVARGTLVSLDAQPAEGHEFVYWNVNGVLHAVEQLEMEMQSSLSVIAHFQPEPEPEPEPDPGEPDPGDGDDGGESGETNVYALAVARGICADWLDKHFKHTDTMLDPDVDYDGDGMTLYEEYIAGTDPLDYRSTLRLSAVAADGGVVLRWPAVNGRAYKIEYTTCLTEAWKPLPETERTVDGDIITIIDHDAAVIKRMRLYRIGVRIEESK